MEIWWTAFLLIGQIDHKEGYVSRYDETPTVATIAYQQERGRIPNDLSEYDGVFAAYKCSWVGREADLILWDGSSETARYHVIIFDCAHWQSWLWMLDAPYVGEAGYSLASKVSGYWATLELKGRWNDG